MTTKIVSSFFLLATVLSCNQSPKHDNPQQELPKALEDKDASYSIVSKSRYEEDLVESLYKELAEKKEDLKTLESQIRGLNESKGDSTASFDKFNGKNRNYYASANQHIDGLSDSLLKLKMQALISASLNKYNGAIGRHSARLKNIGAQDSVLTDLHTALKIIRTLPLMEEFQKNNLPSTKPLDGYLQKQAEAIKLADTLWKK